MLLFLKNLAFTVLVPGFVAGWVPLRWFARHPRWPESWTWNHGAGLALAAAGAAIYLHCIWLFATRGHGTPAPFDPPRQLVHRGLYRWTRNPMYGAVLGVVAGEALFLWSVDVAVYLFCLALAFHLWVILFEESSLAFHFGAGYEDYRREVPRWWPRRPRA